MRGGQGRERWEGWILGAGKAAGLAARGPGFSLCPHGPSYLHYNVGRGGRAGLHGLLVRMAGHLTVRLQPSRRNGSWKWERPAAGFCLFLYPTEYAFSPQLLRQVLTALGYLTLLLLLEFLIEGRVG